ncbi:MAG TPA: MBL fold metallo-hydrolase [Solirubrobacteraceae bacterium]|jgi:glyoxylase-like metal-dependent hydrolase (beta-lactamase superfamily II)
MTGYRHGLHELGDGLCAYLQPEGGWGLSNAGLISAPGASLLVDTLYDLRRTAAMLESMAPRLAASPLRAAFNTHGDPDHCFGNQLLPADATVIATRGAADAMARRSAAAVRQMLGGASLDPAFAAFARERFGSFDFEGIEQRLPSETFEGRREAWVGERLVELIELGPAHSEGDAIAHVPDAAVVFTGDLVFAGGTPIVWAGPISRWLAACDAILTLGARTIVPGHGPLSNADAVRSVQRYLRHVHDEAARRFEAGMAPEEAADDIELGDFAALGDPERIVVNVETVYRELDPSRPPQPVPELFARMARWAARH